MKNCELAVSFEIVSAFEWLFIIIIYKVRKPRKTKLGLGVRSQGTLPYIILGVDCLIVSPSGIYFNIVQFARRTILFLSKRAV